MGLVFIQSYDEDRHITSDNYLPIIYIMLSKCFNLFYPVKNKTRSNQSPIFKVILLHKTIFFHALLLYPPFPSPIFCR